MDNEIIELSSQEIEMLFNLMDQINSNIVNLQDDEIEMIEESEEINEEETEIFQLKSLNETVYDYIELNSAEVPDEETELFQLKQMNDTLTTLTERTPEYYYDELAALELTMSELTESFNQYQEYHYSTNQLYQFSTLLIYPLGLIYFVYRIIKKFIN